MAFSNYSNLFRCGLLSEGSSPSYTSAPWATEYCGPRRGSLPTIDTFSDKSDLFTLQPPPSSSSVHDTVESSAGEEALYFTFKKKRNLAEHRSFLSLDLAESHSLRSVSLKGKENAAAHSERMQQTRSSVSSPSSPSNNHSFMLLFSPPPPFSPPGSPISANSLPDPSRSIVTDPSTSSAQRPASVIHSPSPRYNSFAFPSSPSSSIRRDLSPMRFAEPSPPPPHSVNSDNDAVSEKSIISADLFSRSSIASSGYRRTQRGDALKRLEGRGADGAVGRLKPRLSQNFMHLSDDEDEDVVPWSAGRSMNVIVEDLTEDEFEQSRRSSHSRSRSWASKERNLSLPANAQPWYNLTPRQSAWGVLFGGEVDGDIDIEVDKIFGLDTTTLQPDSPQSDDSCASRKPKRSKRSYSSRSMRQGSEPSIPVSVPFPTQTLTRSLHPLDTSTSTSSSASFISQPPLQPHRHSKLVVRPLALNSDTSAGVRQRTVSDLGSSNPHALVQESRSRSKPTRPRLELRLDWLATPTEEPSFIDMRDESLETESRSDSWRSLFEVSCAA